MKRLNRQEEQPHLPCSQEKTPLKKLISIAEAAAYLGVSKRTISTYISNGQIQVINIGSRCRIPKESLNLLLKTNTYKAPVSIDFKEYTTFYKIADEYHRSYNFVRAVCHEQDLKPIVRSSIQYYRKDEVAEAFDQHYAMLEEAALTRRKEFARRKKIRRSKEYISEYEYEHSPDYYTFPEVMKVYHLARNQVERYCRECNIPTHHEKNFRLISRKEFDEIFSITLPFIL